MTYYEQDNALLSNPPSNAQNLTYEQFQEQQRQRAIQEQVMARQALRSAGLDSRSQQFNALIGELQMLEDELRLAINQAEMQLNSQRRMLEGIVKKMQQAAQTVKMVAGNVDFASQDQKFLQ